MAAAAGISGSVMTERVFPTDGAVMEPATARMDLMRWNVVCIKELMSTKIIQIKILILVYNKV